MAPPVALRREEERKPHPRSLAPVGDVFTDGSSHFRSLNRQAGVVPPLAHRRGSASNPLEVRVRANILSVLDIDLVAQNFKCSFFIDFTWVDYGLKGASVGWPVPQTINRKFSNQRQGYLITNEDPDHYYFSPQLRLRNLVEGDLEERFEVLDAAPEDPSTPAVVAYRLAGRATFLSLFPLRDFPLDSQTLRIEVTSGWEQAHVRLVRNLKEEYRSVVCRETFTLRNAYKLSGQVHLLSRTTDPRHSSSGARYSCLEVQMYVCRRLPFWVYNVWLPLFFFTIVSFSSLMVEVTALANRLSITLTMLLTQVTYRFSIVEKIPTLGYITYLDLYMMTCFLVTFGVTVTTAVVDFCAQADPDVQAFLEGNWQNPSPWQARERQAMLFMSLAWVGANVLMPMWVFIKRRITHSSEALRWWDLSETVLWCGPINADAADETTLDGLQRAFDAACLAREDHLAAAARAKAATLRSRTVRWLQHPSEEEEEEEAAAHGAHEVRLATLRVVRPAQLQHIRRRHPGMLPVTQQPFVLLECATQSQAQLALELLRDAQQEDLAKRAEELRADAAAATAASDALPAPAEAAAAILARSGSLASPRRTGPLALAAHAISSRLSTRSLGQHHAPQPATLQAVMRAWRLEERRIAIEISLAEFKHLIEADDGLTERGAVARAWARLRRLWRYVVKPRRSTAGMSRGPHSFRAPSDAASLRRNNSFIARARQSITGIGGGGDGGGMRVSLPRSSLSAMLGLRRDSTHQAAPAADAPPPQEAAHAALLAHAAGAPPAPLRSALRSSTIRVPAGGPPSPGKRRPLSPTRPGVGDASPGMRPPSAGPRAFRATTLAGGAADGVGGGPPSPSRGPASPPRPAP